MKSICLSILFLLHGCFNTPPEISAVYYQKSKIIRVLNNGCYIHSLTVNNYEISEHFSLDKTTKLEIDKFLEEKHPAGFESIKKYSTRFRVGCKCENDSLTNGVSFFIPKIEDIGVVDSIVITGLY